MGSKYYSYLEPSESHKSKGRLEGNPQREEDDPFGGIRHGIKDRNRVLRESNLLIRHLYVCLMPNGMIRTAQVLTFSMA